MSGGAGTVKEISSQLDLQALSSGHSGLTAVLLWAPWHAPSAHLVKVVEAIAAEQKSVRFGKVNTDVCPGIASSLGADQVPFAAFLDPSGRKIDSLAGADPPRLVDKVKTLASRPFDSASTRAATCGGGGGGSCGGAGGGGSCGGAAAGGEEDLNGRLRNLVNFSPVMLFMKGSKAEPFCGFSRKAIDMLNKFNVEYSTFDILQDEEVRSGLKEYSNWKTYPQLYIKGELIGGIDIMKEMEEDGSLEEALPKEEEEEGPQDLNSKLRGLVNSAPVMLFMKGSKDQPHCGFSKKAVAMLTESNVEYSTFDILKDEEVRQGLKEFANWKTYPQLYINGELIGGIDIMKEMEEDGSLMEAIPDGAKGGGSA